MAEISRAEGGFLFKRKIDKLVGGASIEWNDVDVRKKIWRAIDSTNKWGAIRMRREMKKPGP